MRIIGRRETREARKTAVAGEEAWTGGTGGRREARGWAGGRGQGATLNQAAPLPPVAPWRLNARNVPHGMTKNDLTDPVLTMDAYYTSIVYPTFYERSLPSSRSARGRAGGDGMVGHPPAGPEDATPPAFLMAPWGELPDDAATEGGTPLALPFKLQVAPVDGLSKALLLLSSFPPPGMAGATALMAPWGELPSDTATKDAIPPAFPPKLAAPVDEPSNPLLLLSWTLNRLRGEKKNTPPGRKK